MEIRVHNDWALTLPESDKIGLRWLGPDEYAFRFDHMWLNGSAGETEAALSKIIADCYEIGTHLSGAIEATVLEQRVERGLIVLGNDFGGDAA